MILQMSLLNPPLERAAALICFNAQTRKSVDACVAKDAFFRRRKSTDIEQMYVSPKSCLAADNKGKTFAKTNKQKNGSGFREDRR